MSNIDKQAVQAVADLKAGYTIGNADVAILNELARIALASLEAEAVAYIIQDADARSRGEKGILRYFANISDEDINEYEITVTPLYAAPPAPVSVPDAMEMDDDFDSAFEHGKAVGWNACRAAMLQGADGKYPAQDGNSPVIQDGYCIMPLKLTAGNGAKSALCGEFHVQYRIVCQSCVGEGCEDCNHAGGWDAEIPVSWDTIKRIHEAAVEACALPAEPQQEVKP
ncbi:TPA: hypothetical protein ACG0DN_000042 [Enterobacter roggenkampii]